MAGVGLVRALRDGYRAMAIVSKDASKVFFIYDIFRLS